MAKEQVTRQGPTARPCRAPPGSRGEPRALLCAGETEAAPQLLLGAGGVQRHFGPLAVFPSGKDPCGAGQKEFRRKLSGCGKLRGRMGVWVRDAAEMREQGWPGREPRGQATATRAGREMSLLVAADLGQLQGRKGNGGAQPGAGGGSQGSAIRGDRTRALSVPLRVTRPGGVPGSWDAQGWGARAVSIPRVWESGSNAVVEKEMEVHPKGASILSPVCFFFLKKKEVHAPIL